MHVEPPTPPPAPQEQSLNMNNKMMMWNEKHAFIENLYNTCTLQQNTAVIYDIYVSSQDEKLNIGFINKD